MHRLLKIDEAEFLSRVQGTFKLAIQFENWRAVGHDYIHSFGFTGQGCWAAGFHAFWLKARALGFAEDYGRYAPELMAAKAGRFGLLQQDALSYAYHIDATAYAGLLREQAEKDGVTRIEGRIVDVHQTEAGNISEVVLESGKVVKGDLFIDCSGFVSLLLDKALGTEFEDWTHWLPCDRAIAVQTASVGDPIPYTRSIARESGWQWRIPLQTLSHRAAGKTLESQLCWARPGGWLPRATGIDQYSPYPARRPPADADVPLCRHHGVGPSGVQSPDGLRVSLRPRLHHPALPCHGTNGFRVVFEAEKDIFRENSWVQVMLGQGVEPQNYHPIVDMMDERELRQFMRFQQQRVDHVLSQLPTHQEFIDGYCPVA